MLKFYTFWGAGESIGGGGQAPPGVRVILTLCLRLLRYVRYAQYVAYVTEGGNGP